MLSLSTTIVCNKGFFSSFPNMAHAPNCTTTTTTTGLRHRTTALRLKLHLPNKKLQHLSSSNISSYTSLKDLLRTDYSPGSGSGSPAGSCCDIAIRNRLVKQAALAYLQPMMASSSPSRGTLNRLRSPLDACIGFLHRLLTVCGRVGVP